MNTENIHPTWAPRKPVRPKRIKLNSHAKTAIATFVGTSLLWGIAATLDDDTDAPPRPAGRQAVDVNRMASGQAPTRTDGDAADTVDMVLKALAKQVALQCDGTPVPCHAALKTANQAAAELGAEIFEDGSVHTLADGTPVSY
ncbi:hypothetical protein [Streptomyces sp. cg36]|uniref:hypothetical protein n=1 Tax=Streptomyces sp. cg36 TaxID=3238798 RepID=UPI0034E24E4B